MNKRPMGIGYGFVAALIWGGFPVVTRFGFAHSALDFYDITFIRFIVSGVLLLPVLLRRGLGGLNAAPIALMVIGAGAPYIMVVAAALSRAAVGFFALTPGCMIAFTAVLSGLIMKDRLSPTQTTGIAVVLLGMGLAASNALTHGGGWIVLSLFVCGGLLWAIYNVTTKLWAVDALRATAIVSVGSAFIYTPLYLVIHGFRLAQAPLAAVAMQALYQGVLVSILGLYFFSKAVSILGPAIGATFAALVPLLATVEAELLLGEQPRPLTMLGILVVTIGMIVSLIKPRARDFRPEAA